MQEYELEIILDSLEYTYRQDWEQTRMLMYSVIQSQSTKHFSPKDLISFVWDSKDEENTSMTKDDVERLTKKMNSIIQLNKEKENGRFSNTITTR